MPLWDSQRDNTQVSGDTCVVHSCQGQAISNGRGDEGGTKGITRGKGKENPSGHKAFHTQNDSIQHYSRGITIGHKLFDTHNDGIQRCNRGSSSGHKSFHTPKNSLEYYNRGSPPGSTFKIFQ